MLEGAQECTGLMDGKGWGCVPSRVLELDSSDSLIRRRLSKYLYRGVCDECDC